MAVVTQTLDALYDPGKYFAINFYYVSIGFRWRTPEVPFFTHFSVLYDRIVGFYISSFITFIVYFLLFPAKFITRSFLTGSREKSRTR